MDDNTKDILEEIKDEIDELQKKINEIQKEKPNLNLTIFLVFMEELVELAFIIAILWICGYWLTQM